MASNLLPLSCQYLQVLLVHTWIHALEHKFIELWNTTGEQLQNTAVSHRLIITSSLVVYMHNTRYPCFTCHNMCIHTMQYCTQFIVWYFTCHSAVVKARSGKCETLHFVTWLTATAHFLCRHFQSAAVPQLPGDIEYNGSLQQTWNMCAVRMYNFYHVAAIN